MVALLRVAFGIKVSKMLIFEVFLSLKEALMATFNEMRALTFRKYVDEPGMSLQNYEKKINYFSCNFPFLL